MHTFNFILDLTLIIAAHFSLYLLMSYAYSEVDLNKNIPPLHMPELNDISDIAENNGTITIQDYRYIKGEYKDYLNEYILTAHDYFKLRERINQLQDDGVSAGAFYTAMIEHLLVSSWLTINISNFYTTIHKLVVFLIALVVTIFFTWLSTVVYKHFCPGLQQFDYDKNYIKKEADRIYDNIDVNYYKISRESFVNFFFIKKHYDFLKSVERTVFRRYIFRHIIAYFGFILHLQLYYIFDKMK